MKTSIGWLENELGEWVKEALLSEENATKILARYQNTAPRVNWATAIFAAFGAALIGFGIIAIFAYNWEILTRGNKAALAFAVLLAAQGFAFYAKLKHSQSAAYAEGAGVFLIVAFTAALAIIAQAYHIGGDLIDFTQVVILLTLPIVYIFNSKGSSAIIFIAITALLVGVIDERDHSQTVAWLYFFAWFPWYLYRLIYDRNSAVTHAFNLLFMCGVVIIVGDEVNSYYSLSSSQEMIIFSLCFASFWLASVLLYPGKAKFFKRPVEEVAKLAIAIMLLIGVLDLYKYSYFSREIENISALILLSLPYFALFGFFFYKLRDRYYELIIPLAPFFFFIAQASELGGNAKWLFTIACVAGSASFIIGGTTRLNIALVNQGVVWLAILLLYRFFDSALTFLEKGIAFIVIGVMFIGANVLLSRYIRIRNERA
ncbi:MAG: DUF2157 domain-containing protein [Helicobacteraceae bacterium]|jgi:uncharacterized membrane protein|nr:DUF2157 domain-containing protein [Helicobacteraceae bacterium]